MSGLLLDFADYLQKSPVMYFMGRHHESTYLLMEWKTARALKLTCKLLKDETQHIVTFPMCYRAYSSSSPFYGNPPKCDPFWGVKLPRNAADHFFAILR